MFVPPVVTDDADGAALLVKLAALLVCCAETGACKNPKVRMAILRSFEKNKRFMIRKFAQSYFGMIQNHSLRQQ